MPLTNDGTLSICFVGVGSAFSRRNYQSNFLIVKGDTHLLVDCGTQASRGLADLGLSVLDIDNVLITHSHADHIGGLEELMLMNRYVKQRKPRILINRSYQKILWSQSLRGGCEMNEIHSGRGLGFEDYWEIQRPEKEHSRGRETEVYNLGELTIRTFRTRHYPQQAKRWNEAMYSVGVVIDDRVIVSGDTQFDRDLLTEYADQYPIERIFQDAQFFTGGIHASLEELESLPESIRAMMHLYHYGDNFEEKRQAVAQGGFKGFAELHKVYRFPL
ncbi:MAG: MBL fold metallo-hydrolase [Alkalispirochaetaceae bacterium]